MNSEPEVCANCGKTGDLKVCGKCHVVKYCTRDCQKTYVSLSDEIVVICKALEGAQEGLPSGRSQGNH